MNILWLTPNSPWPPHNGGKLRVYNLVRQVLAAGHAIDLWCVSADSAAWPSPQPEALRLRSFPIRQRLTAAAKLAQLVSPLPEQAWNMRAREVVKALEMVGGDDHDLILFETAHMGSLLAEARGAGLPLVVNTQNVEWDLLRQVAWRRDSLLTRLRYRFEAEKLRRLEIATLRSADLIAAVSEADAAVLQRYAPATPVRLHPNGVDLDYNRWSDHRRNRCSRLLMTGPLDYWPNFDSARWMKREIMPLVRRREPGSILSLVGGGVPDGDLHNPAEGIEVAGAVDDIRPHYRQADLFVIAHRIGGGTRLKALEALAAGIPIVATPVGVRGLGLESQGLVLVGDTAERVSEQIIRGLTDEDLRERLSVEGRRYVESSFDWRLIGKAFAGSLESAVAHRRPPPHQPIPR